MSLDRALVISTTLKHFLVYGHSQYATFDWYFLAYSPFFLCLYFFTVCGVRFIKAQKNL